MKFLLSAKNGDVTNWGGGKDFATSYRQVLLDLTASDISGSAETFFSEASATLENAITTHQNLVNRLNSTLEEVASAPSTVSLRELTVSFYADLYSLFGQFRSVPAFYQFSMVFLRRISSVLIVRATDQLGLSGVHLPDMELIAVGQAGKYEYSPFSHLQILLVHGEPTASQLQAVEQFGLALHDGFEAAGLAVDPVVTPRNERWRGTLTDWRQRCEKGLRPQTDDESISLCRLSDLSTLNSDKGLGLKLRDISSRGLDGSRPVLASLIERMAALSNGLGIMGRLKVERSGSRRGMFRLHDHGILPLSVALSALALIREVEEVSSCERIHELLRRRELDVEMAERMLAAWYTLHDLRLRREQSLKIGELSDVSSCLDPDELTAEQRYSLKEALESTAIIQRYVEMTFSGMGE